MITPAASPTVGSQNPALSDATFRQVVDLAYSIAGFSIADSKKPMVRTRLARRLRELNIPSFEEYYAIISSEKGQHELPELISALSTNVSHFFRENHHFEKLKTEIAPLLRKKLDAGGRVRLWSAGCSNGQEPYSIAMTLLESNLFQPKDDIKILATDIDKKVVQFARAGTYPVSMISGLPEDLQDKYFDHIAQADSWKVRPELRQLITFNELNLLHSWPMKGCFDVIFCRNVVIYFDAETQANLWKGFHNFLAPDGWLMLGHSERISEEFEDVFKTEGITAYQRAH